jgi:phytoene dehydrogenase-like protein
MNVADLLEETFETDALRGAFALDAVLGNNHGPRSPNTVFTLLHRFACHRAGGSTPVGGIGHRVDALAGAAESAGVDIRSDARVERIQIEKGKARGIVLAGGGTIDAQVVVSNADPVTTFVDLVGADHLDADFMSDVKAIRTDGVTGRVLFSLDDLPDLPTPAGRWLIAPSIDYVETAFDHAKYGENVPEPALEITLPSLGDPRCAPEGKHVMSVNVAYAPCSTALAPDTLGDAVTATIERCVPGFSKAVLAREAWGPREIEQRFGTRGGHWHHGDIALDQFFVNRPVPGFARYRTPIAGLYLCGAGTHPGGGVTGTNGFNAAREILRDRGRRAA